VWVCGGGGGGRGIVGVVIHFPKCQNERYGDDVHMCVCVCVCLCVSAAADLQGAHSCCTLTHADLSGFLQARAFGL
jgi:hypothetical protein